MPRKQQEPIVDDSQEESAEEEHSGDVSSGKEDSDDEYRASERKVSRTPLYVLVYVAVNGGPYTGCFLVLHISKQYYLDESSMV